MRGFDSESPSTAFDVSSKAPGGVLILGFESGDGGIDEAVMEKC